LTGIPRWRKLTALMVLQFPDLVRVHLRWSLAILLGMAPLGAGCGEARVTGEPRDSAANVGDGAADGEADANELCPEAPGVPSFAQDLKPFLDTHCNVCHSTHPRDGGFAPRAQDFETYAGFKPWAETSLMSMRLGSMPPPESDPAASAADVCMLKAWIDQGAPSAS
jgi:hypothetical protein